MTDKALLKAAGIIGIVLGIICCLTIIGIIFGIPMIIGGYTFYNYSNMEESEIINNKSTILGWSIFFLIFSLISGILGLVYYFSLNKYEKQNQMTYLDEIERLKKLYDEKAITKAEYDKKKKEILGEN